jgi:ribonucleoside-diphosphate reductase alpha chain
MIQKYVDSSISSTVNLPEDIDVETVADIYLTAYHERLKGITVYREGSREGILISRDKESQSAQTTDQNVPQDGQMPDNSPKSSPELEIAPPESHTRQLSQTGDSETADKPHLHPRKRPETTHGVTRRVRTGEGNLYITINEDVRGLCEVFTTIGKAGGVASTQAEAISRLISLALRSGVDAHEIVKQLKGISGPSPTWENGRLILSTPDAIGQALSDYLDQRPQHKWEIVDNNATLLPPPTTLAYPDSDREENSLNSSAESEEGTSRTMTTCPDCGCNVTHESGCVTCHFCGYSRC